VQLGELVGEKWDKMHDISRRVYAKDGLAPTVHCQQGGNTELKIAEDFVLGGLQEHQKPRTDGISPTLTEAMGKGGGQTPLVIDTNDKEERFFKQAFETMMENDCEVGDTVDAFNKKINKSGVCPTITTRPEGFKTAILPVVEDNREVAIGAMRGRNPDNPSDRTAGVPTEQRLEVNDKGISNALTTVQKDNLVVENGGYIARCYGEFVEQNGYVPEMFVAYNRMEVKDLAPTLTGQCCSASGSSAVLKIETADKTILAPNNWEHKAGDGTATRQRRETDICPALQATPGQTQQAYVKVKVATKLGYEEASEGDYVNISYPNSNTKRGRVGKGIAHTLTCSEDDAVITENVRIRKLTPKECLRLMGWKDEQIDKIQQSKISGTQQYRQAGNGIVVQVLEAIFKALFFEEE
jgi:DNA (cytosine-5)-methyltransferase 1